VDEGEEKAKSVDHDSLSSGEERLMRWRRRSQLKVSLQLQQILVLRRRRGRGGDDDDDDDGGYDDDGADDGGGA